MKHLPRPAVPLSILIVSITVIAAMSVLVTGVGARSGQPPPGWPTGTVIGRLADDLVDVVMWDGTDWQTVLPETELAPLVIADVVRHPRIDQLIVSPDGGLLGLTVVYCAGSNVVETQACTGRGYLYDIATAELTSLGERSPVAWLDAAARLVVEDYQVGYALVYDVAAREATAVEGIEGAYNLSLSPQGVASTAGLLLFSGEEGEGVLDLNTAAITMTERLSGHNTSWMAFRPDAARHVIVDVRGGEDNRLGGGALVTYDGAGRVVTEVTPSAAELDFNPVWLDQGATLAFLRADGDIFRQDRSVFGLDNEDLPAGIAVYDFATAVTSTLLPPDRVRRQLVGADGDASLLYLERDPDGFAKAHAVSLCGGPGSLMVRDAKEHTAIAVP